MGAFWYKFIEHLQTHNITPTVYPHYNNIGHT